MEEVYPQKSLADTLAAIRKTEPKSVPNGNRDTYIQRERETLDCETKYLALTWVKTTKPVTYLGH
jgi:hypothetical protein